MARLDNRVLFFTTSPRTPSKMIPEISLLCDKFEGRPWNKHTQELFIDVLAQSTFFEGSGSPSDKAFSARDRINRAPKSLGFVDLSPDIALTDAGRAFIFGKRPQEIFLRQLLKFQLPSPYHTENPKISGTFFVRPYLEVLRLIYELEYLTIDELKIFAVQITDYHRFEEIKDKILDFRKSKEEHRGQYKRFVNDTWINTILEIHNGRIAEGRTRTRETKATDIHTFVKTQKSNMRDYADACFRYLRYTELVSIAHKSRTISIFDDKKRDVEFILTHTDRDPVFVDDEDSYKAHLFDATVPELYTDNTENIIDVILGISEVKRSELSGHDIEALKDLRDDIVARHRKEVIHEKVSEIKSYALYSEIIDTFGDITSDEYYDAPLMLEYNTWRAMTMLDGGDIKGNFKFDDMGQPLSTASGNMPDIECDYGDFSLAVEVTLQAGQRQYEAEGESVARHYGQLKKRTGKDTYCIFIAPKVNAATLAHFYGLNHLSIALYGGRTQIIPLELEQFIKLVRNSNSRNTRPTPADIRRFLDHALRLCKDAVDENNWSRGIEACVDMWYTPCDR